MCVSSFTRPFTSQYVPEPLVDYLAELTRRVRNAVGDDLVGLWLIGSAAQGAYEHGTSDVDVMALSRSRHDEDTRGALGSALVHAALPCPTAGLEFVWYALPDLVDLADPVAFQVNVNGGLSRESIVQLEPEGANYWSILDLAAARQVGVTLDGTATPDVLPRIPADRLRQAVRESFDWHNGPDAGSPNRVLNLARLLVLVEQGRWLSKPAGAEELRRTHPELAGAVDEALRARAEGRWMDPDLAAPLSALLAARL